MRTLLRSSNEEKIDDACSLLVSNGIPALIQSESYRGDTIWVLFVTLDCQFEEAIKLLNDPTYEVKEPISLEEYERIKVLAEEESTAATIKRMDRLLNWSMVIILLGLIGGLAYLIYHAS